MSRKLAVISVAVISVLLAVGCGGGASKAPASSGNNAPAAAEAAPSTADAMFTPAADPEPVVADEPAAENFFGDGEGFQMDFDE